MRTHVLRVMISLICLSALLVQAATPAAVAQDAVAPTPPAASVADDEFNGPELNPRWSWYNEDRARWSLSVVPGRLRITGVPGDMVASCNNPRNLLLQDAPGVDFQLTTRLSLSPTSNYQQGGLAIFNSIGGRPDLDNYVKLDISWNSFQSGRNVEIFRETNGFSSRQSIPITQTQDVHLRLVKSGSTFAGFYSADGVQWRRVGSFASNSIGSAKIGIFSIVGLDFIGLCVGGAPNIDVDFDSFHLLDVPRRPLIFVPGIMGSSLYERLPNGSLGEQSWPGQPLWCTDHRHLALNSGRTFAAGDAIRRHVTDCTPLTDKDNTDSETYTSLLDRLAAAGYVEYDVGLRPSRRTFDGCDVAQPGATLFVFAYDWRRSNKDSARDLREYVRCVRRLNPDADGVDVLTHSMGGLVARRFILDTMSPGQAVSGLLPVKRLITLAAPWLGAPRAVDILQNGVYAPFSSEELGGYGALLTPTELKTIARTFPGAHELLPSVVYAERYPAPVFREDGWDFNSNGVSSENYDYATLSLSADTRYGFGAGINNLVFHSTEQDIWEPLDRGVAYYYIAGVEREARTVGAIRAYASCSYLRGRCITVEKFELKMVDGDGTVPLESAQRHNAGASYLEVRGADEDEGVAEHGEIVKNSNVQACILAILSSPAGAAPACPKLAPQSVSAQVSAAGASTHALYIDITGAASVTVADSFGNLSDTAGDPNNPPPPPTPPSVPNLDIFRTGDLSLLLVLPATQAYTITLRTSAMPVLIDARRGDDQETAEAVRYLDLELPANVDARFVVDVQGMRPLSYDVDRDGIFETEVAPTAALRGVAAQDAEPPQIAFSWRGSLDAAVVTLAASDAGSGVQRLLYSLDGTTFQPYTGPVQVDPLRSPVIYAFADDVSANRSGIQTHRLVYQLSLPGTRR